MLYLEVPLRNKKMLVTDIKRVNRYGKEVTGFLMDGYLKENLDDVPAFLNKAWDAVGIVSGHGKVRIGKSTLAMQIAYYLAWRIAGGEMKTSRAKKKKGTGRIVEGWVIDEMAIS